MAELLGIDNDENRSIVIMIDSMVQYVSVRTELRRRPSCRNGHQAILVKRYHSIICERSAICDP